MILKVVKRAMGKDAMTRNNQIHLDLQPDVLSELIHSKIHPLPLQCLSGS